DLLPEYRKSDVYPEPQQHRPAAETTVPEQPQPAGRQPVLQLPDANIVPRSIAESETGFSRLAAGALSAVRGLVSDRYSRRSGAVSLAGVERSESVQQRIQLPGCLRVHSREDEDQRLREWQRLQRSPGVSKRPRV